MDRHLKVGVDAGEVGIVYSAARLMRMWRRVDNGKVGPVGGEGVWRNTSLMRWRRGEKCQTMGVVIGGGGVDERRGVARGES